MKIVTLPKLAWRLTLLGEQLYPAALTFMIPYQSPAQASAHQSGLYLGNSTQTNLTSYKDPRDNWSFQARIDDKGELKDMLREHAVIGGMTYVHMYDQNSDADTYQQKVHNNTQRLTDWVGKAMGPNKKDEFRSLWQHHIDLLVMYASAVKNNNNTDIQNASMNLDETSVQFATFFSKGSNSKDELHSMFQMHIDQEKAIIDAHADGNDDQMRELFKEADMHMSMLADRLTDR